MPSSSSGRNFTYPFCSQNLGCGTLSDPIRCLDGYCDNGICRQKSSCPAPNICDRGNCINPSGSGGGTPTDTVLCSQNNPPPNPPRIIPASIVRPDLPIQTAIPGIYWTEGDSSLRLTISSSEPDSDHKTSYANWTVYDKPFNDKNINNDTGRLVWTQRGTNPQTFTLNTKLHPKNLPAGVHKITFLTTKGKCDGTGISTYLSIDNPDENESPYIREIPKITLHEGDQTILNLDELGFDPDRNKDTLGMITYSIVSVKPEIEGIRLCSINPITNNQNHVITLAPPKSGKLETKDILVTIRATDGGTPGKSFDRTFNLKVLSPDIFPTIINPSNLQNCFAIQTEPEPILDIESLPLAQVTSLPRVFNIVKLLSDLGVREKIKAFRIVNSKLDLFNKWLNQSIGKEDFVGSLISGGHGYVGIKLNPETHLMPDEIFLLNFLIKSKADNQMYDTLTKVVSFNPETKDLLLEVGLTDEIPPGEATLVINNNKDGNSRFISRVALNILPRVLATLTKNQAIDKPIIKKVKLIEIPNQLNTNPKKKQYLLVIKGNNFMKSVVNINNQKVSSPIGNLPFTTLTFANNDKITLRKIRVKQNPSDITKTIMKVRLEYDISGPVNSDDVRYFTVSTLSGQETGKIIFNRREIKLQNNTPEQFLNNPPDKPQAPPFSDTALLNDQTITTTPVPTNEQAPIFIAPIAPLNLVPQLGGRPPEFTGAGRPPNAFGTLSGFVRETNSIQANKQIATTSLNSPDRLPVRAPSFEVPVFDNSNISTPRNSDTPEIKLIPTEILSLRSDTSLSIDIKSLDLSGPEQIILTPSIPLISFIQQTLQTAETESVKSETATPKKQVIDNSPIQTSETHGIIKSGFSGYTIKLKDGVKLKQADFKNIIYIVIDNKKKVTVIPSDTLGIKSNNLIAKLSFPETINNGVATLITVLNKGGGKKETLSKGTIKLFNSYDFENVGEKGNKTSLPKIKQIQGRITSTSKKGGKIIRLTLFGEHFASRLIKINGKEFIAEPSKSHTFVSFTDESNIKILRTRVLNKGRQILLTIRFTGDDISKRSFTVSTPKGQFFTKKLEIKLLSKPPVRNVILEPDNETDKTDIKPQKKK